MVLQVYVKLILFFCLLRPNNFHLASCYLFLISSCITVRLASERARGRRDGFSRRRNGAMAQRFLTAGAQRRGVGDGVLPMMKCLY